MDLNSAAMRILFICPKFNGYENLLIEEMRSLDFNVTFFPDKPPGFFYRLLSFFPSFIKDFLIKSYLESIIKCAESEDFDSVFVVKGTVLDSAFMISLKNLLPNSKFLMYQWDSSLTHKSYLRIAKFFDEVYTFDRLDASDNNFKYLPLFYSKYYSNVSPVQAPDYDMVFVGEYYPDSDRLAIVKRIKEVAKREGLKFKFSLRVDLFALFKFILYRQLSILDIPYISIGRMSQENVVNVYSNSTAVLDIEHNQQNGLTMRTMEVLGAGLKLVTTNKNIYQEDFFNEERILIIDREKPILTKSFFESAPLAPINPNYSIRSWLKLIL